MSSAQLKCLETSDSGGFLMEIGYFSIFWQFSMESADAKRVLRAGIIWDGAGEFKEVMVGVGCENMVVFGEISLLVAFLKI